VGQLRVTTTKESENVVSNENHCPECRKADEAATSMMHSVLKQRLTVSQALHASSVVVASLLDQIDYEDAREFLLSMLGDLDQDHPGRLPVLGLKGKKVPS
jgi:hypothetical protein